MITGIWSIVILLITGLVVLFDHRTYKSRLRSTLIILSGMLLLGFVNEPKWWPSDSGKYALITDGFEADDINQNQYEEIFSLRNEDKFTPGITWLSSVFMISDEIPSGSGVDLFGSGVKGELPENYRWFDQLQDPGKGLLLERVPKQVEVGSSFEFAVTAKGAADEDSIQVYKDGMLWESLKIDTDSAIVLQDQLNMQGPVTYDIEWLDEDSLFTESLNIRAVQPELLTFGILMYSPSFEINYLAEHFGERGHTIMSRTRVGQQRFRFDAINARTDQAESIIDNLSSMDILILDSREYAELPPSAREQVKESVQNGLDILLRSPGIEHSEHWAGVFSEIADQEVNVQQINRLEERNWLPGFMQDNEEIINPSPLLNVDFIELPGAAGIIYQNAGNEAVSVRIRSGSGSVTSHIFYQTYNWLLEGETEAYNHFWADYLSLVVDLENTQVDMAPSITRINEMMNIFITQPSEIKNVLIKPVYSADSLWIPVSQNPSNLDVLVASFWPNEPGWHFLEYGGQKNWFYVYRNGWEHDAAVKRYDLTRKQIAKTDLADVPLTSSTNAHVPNWIWLIGFMLIQFTLWIERKLK